MPPDYLRCMSSAQTTLALGELERVDSDTAARIAHAAKYHEALSGQSGLITPGWQDDSPHIYTYYPIQCRDRETLLDDAMRRGRDFAAQHLRNCADLPDFREFYRDCPNARAAARELVLLPTHPRYPAAEIDRNIEVVLRHLVGESRPAGHRRLC